MSMVIKQRPDFSPVTKRKPGGVLSVRIAPEPAVRSAVSRDEEVTWHFSERGDVVAFDLMPAARKRRPARADPERDLALFMSISNAAERAGVHPATLRKMAADGRLRALRLNGEWVTTLGWLREFEKGRKGPGRPRKTA
jgi:excisionase family DNA binding protein